MMTEASADVCSISRMLTKRDIQLARGVQQECANDNCSEPAGLCSHLRSGLALLHMELHHSEAMPLATRVNAS